LSVFTEANAALETIENAEKALESSAGKEAQVKIETIKQQQ